jgi:hypothetical protein
VRTIPHTPALCHIRQNDSEDCERADLQDTEAKTYSHCNFLLLFHVEIPDNEPREDREGEVGGDKPRCKST